MIDTRCKTCNKDLTNDAQHDLKDCIAHLRSHDDIKALLQQMMNDYQESGDKNSWRVVEQVELAIEAMEA